MSRYDKPRRIGEVIGGLVDRLGIRQEMDEAEIIEAWAAVAGPEINAVTESAWMKSGKLFVRITSPARRQQLHMNRSRLRDQVNAALGKEVIAEIVFR
ncbi:MAG: DUF721 domain-containing protein [Rhodothermales bacterium]